jgi:hypothetical protein
MTEGNNLRGRDRDERQRGRDGGEIHRRRDGGKEPEENSNREKEGREQAREEREKKDGEKEGERKGAIWQSCTDSPVLAVCLGISACHHLPVPLSLSHLGCSVQAFLF